MNYDDIALARLELFENRLNLSRLAETAYVLNLAGESFETMAERIVVLESEDRCWYEEGDLLIVAHGLKRCPYGQLRLAEPDIAADETIHWGLPLHIGLAGLIGLVLVGRILIEERGFELLLHIAIGGEGETLLLLTLGVERDKLSGDVLDAALGLGL